MTKQLKNHRYSLLMVLCGVVIGLVLAAGINITGDAAADVPGLPAGDSGEPAPAPAPIDPAATSSLMALSNAFADVAEAVNPAVVTISTKTTVRGPNMTSPLEQFFRFQLPQQGERVQTGLGSGVIVREDGVILTNNHVIANADDIVVKLLDGREFEAEVKGLDPRTDLAVITIAVDGDIPAVELGDSDAMRVGEWVLAIGSPLQAEFAHTVTSGIVSAIGRTGVGLTPYEDFIQTDAAINPGNSGGALVNLRGKLIGINTAIASRSGGSIGIGFAIPSNLARKVMTDILEKGKVVRGWLGVQIGNITPGLAKQNDLSSSDGVFISSVVEDGPADKGGLEAGDIVLEIDGKRVRNTTELSTKIGATEPGTRVSMKILRDGREKNIDIRLGEFADDGSIVSNSGASGSFDQLGFDVQDLSSQLRRQFDLEADEDGVAVTAVVENSVAARSGLRIGDVIQKVNRNRVSSVQQLTSIINGLQPGDPVALFVKRENKRIFIPLDIPRR